VTNRQELVLAWDVAAAAIAQAQSQLKDVLQAALAEGPIAVNADVAWLDGPAVVELFETAASAGPIVWCTDRPDVRTSRTLDTPARWWQFRRRARHGALTH
jgi:hypothetical protein